MPARYSRRPGPPGDAVTVADSELIRTPSPRRTRRMRTQTRRAPPITGSGRLPQLDLALGTRHHAGGRSGSAVGYQLRSPASLVSPVRGRMKAESRQQPGEASAPANGRRRCCWRTRTHDLTEPAPRSGCLPFFPRRCGCQISPAEADDSRGDIFQPGACRSPLPGNLIPGHARARTAGRTDYPFGRDNDCPAE